MACADVAYLEGQVALRNHAEKARVDPESLAGMATPSDLEQARSRLRGL
jgi:hypothetical protein